MIPLKKIIFFVFFLIISACSSIPKNTQNSCAIFEERYLWYKHSKAAYKKYGAPIHLQLAFIKPKEARFLLQRNVMNYSLRHQSDSHMIGPVWQLLTTQLATHISNTLKVAFTHND